MGAQFGGLGSSEELDQLAGYAAGLLDGTPDGEEVQRRVTTDPAWASAYAALLQSDPAVRAELADLGAVPLHLPGDIAARIDTALSTANHTAARTPVSSLAEARARRRRRQWTVGVGIAAAVTALAALAGPALFHTGAGGLSTATSGGKAAAPLAGDAATGQQVPPAAPEQPALTLTASGLDYQPGGGKKMSGSSIESGTVAPVPDTAGNAMNAPAALNRLVDPAARQACLAAVATVEPGRPVRVDYARFSGTPALIVFVTRPSDSGVASRLVAVGPSCGLPGAGADLRYAGPA